MNSEQKNWATNGDLLKAAMSENTMTPSEIRERLWASRGLGGIELSNDEFQAILESLDHLSRPVSVSDEDVERMAAETGKEYGTQNGADPYFDFSRTELHAFVAKLRTALEADRAGRGVGVPEPAKVPETYTEQVYALARRCLWIAFNWNDHNFDDAKKYARDEAAKCGLHDFDAANQWLDAQGNGGVRDGWKLVPVEPTPKMIDSTFNDAVETTCGIESHNTRNRRIYKAMLAAAPQPDAEGG